MWNKKNKKTREIQIRKSFGKTKGMKRQITSICIYDVAFIVVLFVSKVFRTSYESIIFFNHLCKTNDRDFHWHFDANLLFNKSVVLLLCLKSELPYTSSSHKIAHYLSLLTFMFYTKSRHNHGGKSCEMRWHVENVYYKKGVYHFHAATKYTVVRCQMMKYYKIFVLFHSTFCWGRY